MTYNINSVYFYFFFVIPFLRIDLLTFSSICQLLIFYFDITFEMSLSIHVNTDMKRNKGKHSSSQKENINFCSVK